MKRMSNNTPLSPDVLASMAKAWRRNTGLSQAKAARRFGIPLRTWQHMEQGRGFRYPWLMHAALILTLKMDDDNEAS